MPHRGSGSPSKVSGSSAAYRFSRDHCFRRRRGPEHAAPSRHSRPRQRRQQQFIGDGTLSTFDGPARAIECACALREAVKPLGIEIRAGVHTGEIELRGDDIGGIAVHIGARVDARVGRSEILVSQTVADVVAGSGIQFEPRGAHELKGVPGTWQLSAVLRTGDNADR
jgi:class 3 adenylate cyclase